MKNAGTNRSDEALARQEVIGSWRLSLGNGESWIIWGADDPGAELARHLARVLRLPVGDDQRMGESRACVHRLKYFARAGQLFAQDGADDAVRVLHPATTSKPMEFELVSGAEVIAQGAEANGGLLLHGALAEREGCGIILAGPGSIGKTTASNRLPPPWRSLSDDTTLVVRDADGAYRAHPWPTWSRFLCGGSGGSWRVEHAVPLRGIFFLAQAQVDRAERVGAGHTATHLVQTSNQAWWRPFGLPADQLRLRRLQTFESVCALAKAVPGYQLELSLTGAFWHEIERVLGWGKQGS